ncbi:MAG: hypothetical protein VCA36_10155, partial [Opitutales bacterium]
MTTKLKKVFPRGLILLFLGAASLGSAQAQEDEQPPLTQAGQRIEAHYAQQLENLRAQLSAKIAYVPPPPTSEKVEVKKIDFSDTKGGKKKGDDLSLDDLLGGDDDGAPKQAPPQKKEPTQEEIFAPFLSSDLLDDL